MKKIIIKAFCLLALGATPTIANAQKLHYVADLETSHLWRGQEVSKGLTFDNEFAITDNHNHFRFGLWGGMQIDGDYKEVDWYASYTYGGFNIALWDIYNFSDDIWADGAKQYRYFNYDCHDTGHFFDLGVNYDFGVHGFPLKLSWTTLVAGRDRGTADKQNIYSTWVQAAYTIYENDKFKVDASVAGAFALNNYDENENDNFYGKSAGVNDVRLGCTYKLRIAKHPFPITSQVVFNPENNKGYFRVAVNLLNL
ncbi:MAG: hypothetical protein ACOYJF_09915 [Prevotella sp.]|jgi:hypothetical protein